MPSPQPYSQGASYYDSQPPPQPPPQRSGASMFNRPYDVADAGVSTVGEDLPEGLASNYAAYQENRARYFMSLQEQMEELAQSEAGTDTTDMTVAPSATPSIAHGAQDADPQQWYPNGSYEPTTTVPDSIVYPDEQAQLTTPHRSATFALPPTQTPLALTAPPSPSVTPSPEITPSALPRRRRRSPPSMEVLEEARSLRKSVSEGIRAISGAPVSQPSNRSVRAAMIADGVLTGTQRTTESRRQAYDYWVRNGRNPASKPSFAE